MELPGGLQEKLEGGFLALQSDIQALNASVDNLSALFVWGASEIIGKISRVGDTLDELLRIAKSPEETWAYEQFTMSKRALSKGFTDEALNYLSKAIDGDGRAHSGYPLDHRFHFFRGQLHSSFGLNPPVPEAVDLRLAEKSFLLAARCSDDPKAKAHLC